MKFNIFWMWNPSFPYCLMVWYKHYLRLMKRDFQKSQIIWYLLFSVCEKSDETSKLHRNSDFITFKEEMSKLLRISAFQHTLCRFSISLSLPLPLSVSLVLSLSHKEECHFVSGFLCLFSPEWCLNADSLQDFSPPVYILLMPKLNIMVKIWHTVSFFFFFFKQAPMFVLVLFLIHNEKMTD